MDLFGFKNNGSVNTKNSFAPTSGGYEEVHQSILTAHRNGYRVDPSNENVRRMAAYFGKTVEDYLKYDIGQY